MMPSKRETPRIRQLALEAVADRRAYQRNADELFFESVRDADAVGCSQREIAKAAGYKSPTSIQRILEGKG